jgi:enterochelin esterase family protein
MRKLGSLCAILLPPLSTLSLFSSKATLKSVVKMKTFNELKIEVESTPNRKKKTTLVNDYIKKRAVQGGFPVVEGENATFVYVGKVENKISVAGDINNYDLKADYLEKIEGTNLYYKLMRFPLDSRIEYTYVTDGNFTLDPLNKNQSFGGLGPFSELQMPKYTSSKEINYNPKVTHGKIHAYRFGSEILDNDRMIHIYLPPGYDSSENYPVIYAQDGSDYLRFGSFDNVLDNLIEERLIEKVLAVFVDPTNRISEYDLNDDYVDFLAKELIPHIDANYSTIDDPSKRLVLGASFGGLISIYVAFMHPEIFGNAASQSGYLSRKEDWMISQLEKGSKKKIRFYLDCGTFETNVGLVFGNFIEGNRRMRQTMERRGYNFVYQEFHEGHNWGNWRSRISDILKTFYGRQGMCARKAICHR